MTKYLFALMLFALSTSAAALDDVNALKLENETLKMEKNQLTTELTVTRAQREEANNKVAAVAAQATFRITALERKIGELESKTPGK